MCTGTHPYIPAINVVEARLVFATPGGQAQNVLNFLLETTPSPATVTQVAADVVTWWNDNLKTQTHALTSLQKVVATDLTSATGYQIEYTDGLPIAGSNSGVGLPDNVSLATKHTTIRRGRSYRGRTYQVGMPEGALDTPDTVLESYQTAINEAYQNLLSGDFVTNNELFVIVSRCQNNVWLTEAEVTAVLNNETDRNIDSQRRRLIGRGV